MMSSLGTNISATSGVVTRMMAAAAMAKNLRTTNNKANRSNLCVLLKFNMTSYTIRYKKSNKLRKKHNRHRLVGVVGDELASGSREHADEGRVVDRQRNPLALRELRRHVAGHHTQIHLHKARTERAHVNTCELTITKSKGTGSTSQAKRTPMTIKAAPTIGSMSGSSLTSVSHQRNIAAPLLFSTSRGGDSRIQNSQ